jgi:S-adenosylmethionine hydrolase
MARGVLTLLTDFGRRDPWVAELTGAVLSAWARHPHSEPQPTLVDLTHDIPRGDIAAASWFLERAAATFPPGTVHLAVVDPGVGSARPAVACTARGQCFVGPGNGLLAFLAAEPDLLVVRLEEMCGRGHPRTGLVSATFHGRDLFAPAAARLALGEPVALAGTRRRCRGTGTAAGRGCARRSAAPGLDRRLRQRHQRPGRRDAGRAAAGRRCRPGRGRHGGAGAVPELRRCAAGLVFWYWGSGGTVEIGVPGGSAAERLGLQRGWP